MNDSIIRSRIDPNIKEQATQVLSSMGLSMSDAIRIFLYRVVSEKAIPFPMKMPNDTTIAAMKAVQQGKTRKATLKSISEDWDKSACGK